VPTSNTASIPSNASLVTFAPWQSPQPPNQSLSTNDRRVVSYVTNRVTPLVPVGGAPAIQTGQARQVSRTGRTYRGRQAAVVSNAELPRTYAFDIGILGYPVSDILISLLY
jgi:hypothetical protein